MVRPNNSRSPVFLPNQSRGIKKSDHTCVKVAIISPVGEALDKACEKAEAEHGARASGKFMPMALSANGQLPATHYACCSRLTPALKSTYDGLLGTEGTKIIQLNAGQTYKDVFDAEGLQRIFNT